ncbi:MAG: BatA domain-containing protein [Gemmatimonadota bacterium]
MSFLFPTALALAVGVAIPLLMHLRRTPTERRIAFPAVRYLRQAERSRSRALRVRDLLLMGLRTGAIALAALAAAGPLVGRGGAGEHLPTDVAIVLDNSASTGRILDDRIGFELLREMALASIALAGTADRFWIYPTVGPPLALGVPPAEAGAGLRRARPTDGFGDVSLVLERALRSLPEGDRKREAHLLSDLQVTGLAGLASPNPSLTDGSTPPASTLDASAQGERVPLLIPILSNLPDRNAAVTAARSSEGSSVPAGVPVFIEVEAARFSGEEAEAAVSSGARLARDPMHGDSARFRVELDGTTVDAVTGLWGEKATVSLPPLDAGGHYVRIELDPSGMRADDSRHLTLLARDAPSVVLIGPEGSFLSAALESLREAGRTGRGAQIVQILEFGAEVATGARPAGDASAVIYIPPEDPVELPRFNQTLSMASIPWNLKPDVVRGDLGIAPTREASRGFVSLASARVLRRYVLERTGPAAEDSVLVRTSEGDAWLAFGRTSGGRATGSRYLVLGSPLAPSATTIPTTALMVPFVERLLQWAMATEAADGHYLAGETYSVPTGTDSVRLPGGTVRRVDSGAPILLPRAGLYRLYRGDAGMPADSSLLAANVPEEEHDPGALEPVELSEMLPGLEVVAVEPGAKAWSRQIFRSRRGRDATAWIVGAVALLLLIETLVVTPGGRDRMAG